MEFVVKYQGVEYRFTVAFESTTFAELGARLEETTSTHFPTQKLIGPKLKGAFNLADHASETLAQAGIISGKRYMLMGSTCEDIQYVHSLKDLPRLRTPEQEIEREAQRSTYTSTTLRPPDGTPVLQFGDRFARWMCVVKYTFGQYQVLEDEWSPLPNEARDLLYRLANDPGIMGIMQRHRWRVGLLSEMSPEGKVGVSRVCVLGYNVNKGQEISLRLRTDDRREFRKYLTIRETLVHELTHMVWSDHDENFKRLNSQLLKECEEFERQSQGGVILSSPAADFPVTDIVAVTATDGQHLGGERSGLDPTAAARNAALARQRRIIEKNADPDASPK